MSSESPSQPALAPSLGAPDDGASEARTVELEAYRLPQQTIGRAGGYELLVELASGGMATVFLGRATDGREGAHLVAIKRPHRHLATDKTYLSMLLDEARLASAIEHPNVVKVRELGFELGEPFIVMDYVEGASLSELRKELAGAERAVDTKIAVRMILDALAGLHAAHELRDDAGRHLGIIHRDVSPHNVLIGCDGVTRLTDFGIAKAEDRVQVTRTHEVKGKLAYLAPERIDKRRMCTVQSDVFSMAVVFWECLAGRRLFRGEEAIDTLQEVMSAPIPRLRRLGARIPAALDDVIARGLSRDLETRYLTAKDFADAIERAAGRANLATALEVAHVVEAVFGPKMRVRHERIREAMSGKDANGILQASGLPKRAPPTPSMRLSVPEVLATVGPPAPSARYTFGNGNNPADYAAKIFPKKTPWGLISALGGGIIMGALLVFAMSSKKAPATPALAQTTQAVTPAASTLRHVKVPLPFVATFVSFDDTARELNPASDVAIFEVPSESVARHRVSAVALDGTRAEAFVREIDGIAQPEDDGFSFESPDLPQAAAAPSVGSPRSPGGKRRGPRTSTPSSMSVAPPTGTVKNGFTKLR